LNLSGLVGENMQIKKLLRVSDLYVLFNNNKPSDVNDFNLSLPEILEVFSEFCCHGNLDSSRAQTIRRLSCLVAWLSVLEVLRRTGPLCHNLKSFIAMFSPQKPPEQHH